MALALWAITVQQGASPQFHVHLAVYGTQQVVIDRLATYCWPKLELLRYLVILLSQGGSPWRAALPVLQASTVPLRVWPDLVAPVLLVSTAPLTFLQPLRIHSSAPK